MAFATTIARKVILRQLGWKVSALKLGSSGGDVVLGPVLAKAGEGTIHEVLDHPEWAAKVFHSGLTDLDAKLDKVAAMVALPPQEAMQRNAFVVLTWPLHVLDLDGVGVGYVMPRIDTSTAVEIHILSNPSNRANPLPSAPQWPTKVTWFHLVNVAANLCLAVEAAHRVGAVIGDFQERNILVADTTEVSLVDCDSMQFTDRLGRQYLCGVGRPEFTAPELAHANLRTQARDVSSDLFALAVHIHLLLMAGNHPFMRGTWTGPGDQPEALTLAKAGHWAGGWNSPLHTHPLAPPVTFLPVGIQRMFLRAFTIGAEEPGLRPSAAEWRKALHHITTTACSQGVHQVPAGCGKCPWCDIHNERASRRKSLPAPHASASTPTKTHLTSSTSTKSNPQLGSKFWERIGIDPIRIALRSDVWYTLRCFVDDAAEFLGDNDKVYVFRSTSDLNRYLAGGEVNSCTDLDGFSSIEQAAVRNALSYPIKPINDYSFTNLAANIAAGPDSVDRTQFAMAVELLEDVAEYSHTTELISGTITAAPLGQLAEKFIADWSAAASGARFATSSKYSNAAASTEDLDTASQQWVKAEGLLDAILHRR